MVDDILTVTLDQFIAQTIELQILWAIAATLCVRHAICLFTNFIWIEAIDYNQHLLGNCNKKIYSSIQRLRFRF